MNKQAVLTLAVFMALMLVGAPLYAGQAAQGEGAGTKMDIPYSHRKAMAPDQPTYEGQGWNCPWCGRMMGQHHQIRGMQAYGWDTGYQPRPAEATDMEPLSIDDAKLLMKNYIRQTNNPNIELGKVTEQEGYYEAKIVTTDGSLVDKIQIHKKTGWFRSAYMKQN